MQLHTTPYFVLREKNMQNIENFLTQNLDKKYAEFHKKLIFSNHQILGVRLPLLRKFAKEIQPEQIELNNNSCHEEILLYGFSSASKSKTEQQQLQQLNHVLPFIDNWATCDCITPTFKKLTGEKSYHFFTQLLFDSREFYARVGIIGLMRFFLKSEKDEEIMQNISKIQNDAYYVKMGIAWLTAELAITNFSLAKNFIEKTQDKFIRNKSISKARESFRVSSKQKDELLQLKKS